MQRNILAMLGGNIVTKHQKLPKNGPTAPLGGGPGAVMESRIELKFRSSKIIGK